MTHRKSKPKKPKLRKGETVMYYIQRHASGYLGNAPMWWCKGGQGYSAYLENAERFTKEDAEKTCGCPIGEKSDKYKAWPCYFIDAKTFTVFDMQYFRELEQWNILNPSKSS